MPKKFLQKDVFNALSRKVREMFPYCQVSDGREHRGYLQAGHIISRTYHGVAFSLADVITICFAHHRYYTDRPIEWEDYWLAKDSRRWLLLKEAARKYAQNPFPKIDLAVAMEHIANGTQYWWLAA